MFEVIRKTKTNEELEILLAQLRGTKINIGPKKL
jgi:hypothetical protein